MIPPKNKSTSKISFHFCYGLGCTEVGTEHALSSSREHYMLNDLGSAAFRSL